MITITGLHKSFGSQTIFGGGDLQINARDRFALVGPNGAGKTTLFRLLLGELEPDSGNLQIKRGTTVGYLPQENAPVSDRSVLEETLKDIEYPDGRSEAKAKAVLMGLGFRVEEFGRGLNTLSGGWAMRVAMARLLLKEPDLLLLDEPTNHLDLDSLLWFRDYLRSYPGAVFLISHDRDFINHLCGAIVSVQDQTLKVYRGDYEAYARELAAARERVEMAYRRQQEEIADMKDFIARNRVRYSTASRVQSMIKRLERLEREELIELPTDAKTVGIRFPQPARCERRVMRLSGIHKSYGDVKVYDGLDFDLERGTKMAFVGHNGAGKSTLLKMLAGVVPFESGERLLGENVKVGYFSQHRAGQLDPEKTVLQEALDCGRTHPELFVRTVLGTFLFPGDNVFKKVEVLSGGEKSRLALVKLLLDPPNVLLLDEPTTHLDIPSVEALVGALKEFEGTICCISHDLYLVKGLADHIVHIEKGKITVYPGDYEYFERRQDQKRAEMPSAAPPPPPPEDLRRAEEKRSRHRRQEAERRIARLERETAAARSRLEKLAGDLANPALYADYAKVQAVTREIEGVKGSLESKQAELDSLRAEADGPQEEERRPSSGTPKVQGTSRSAESPGTGTPQGRSEEEERRP